MLLYFSDLQSLCDVILQTMIRARQDTLWLFLGQGGGRFSGTRQETLAEDSLLRFGVAATATVVAVASVPRPEHSRLFLGFRSRLVARRLAHLFDRSLQLFGLLVKGLQVLHRFFGL